MSDSSYIENDFLRQLTKVVEENLSDEMFGVSELAKEIGMSRSNLLRKIKKLANISASQFIRQVRLRKAMDMLQQTSLTVSEISYKVGFNSTSYFIKCFGDEYGFPPGEAGKKNQSEISSVSQHKQTHQLAAIMFTDIQGFTSLMQKDEKKAIEVRNRHREVFEAVTNKHKGKILQYYGDGTLSTFHSAIDAVRCGIELQLEFREEPKIPVRIGIHSGDILFSDDGIIGDGVNVASRIESLAVAQSVFISEKVYDEVKNQSGIHTTSMGIFELKNVDKPIEVFAITNPGLIVPEKQQIRGKTKDVATNKNKEPITKSKRIGILWILLPMSVMLIGIVLYTVDFFATKNNTSQFSNETNAKKSIAVLPFINDSNDSSNIYIINGLMESTLNNLQKIKELRVISRTSVEKFRNNPKTASEIARELNVQYLIEGSGQKIGDEIMLHIQLIDASSDTHIWAEQYNREAKDIFKLQAEVAKNIADEIQVFITPEVEEMIDKPPTDNLVAYDYFLKGYNLLLTRIPENLSESIKYFENAITEDPEFARAYAAIAIAYYFLDDGQIEKKHGAQINHFADQALLLDPKLPQSLIAKALFYMHNQEYNLAVSYFEKVLEYNPNDDLVYVFLIDLYINHIPDTEKYLQYALKGLEIDVGAYDSIAVSLSYLHLSNAFIQSGFVDEALFYINKSLDYYPENSYSEYVKAYILYAKNRNLSETRDLLIEVLKKDSTRLDIMQEVGKICYFMQDYDVAYRYYKNFTSIREALNLDIYRSEDAKIAYVFSKVGQSEDAEKSILSFWEYANNDPSIYKHINLATYFSYRDEKDKAIEHLNLFANQDHYFYWMLVFAEIDPLFEKIKDLPEFKRTMKDIETKFWKYHKQIRSTLEARDLL